MPIPLSDELVPAGNFPTANLSTIKGAPMLVANQAARDAIPAERRTAGMVVTYTDGSQFKLATDLTTWTPYFGQNIPNSALATVSTGIIKGRVTGSAGPVEDLTGAQATSLLSTATRTTKGLVPAPGAGSTTSAFLCEDMSFRIPGVTGASGASDITFPLTDTLTNRSASFSFSTSTVDTGHSFTMMGIGLALNQGGIVSNEATFGTASLGFGWNLERGFVDGSGNYQHEFYITTSASERPIGGGIRPLWTQPVASIVAHASGAIVTLSGPQVHPFKRGLRIDFPTLNSPSGIAANTFYWVSHTTVNDGSLTSNQFRIATSKANADAGSTAGTTTWTAGTGTVRMGGHSNFSVGGNTPANFAVHSTSYGVLGDDRVAPVELWHGSSTATWNRYCFIGRSGNADTGSGQLILAATWPTSFGQILGHNTDSLGGTGMMFGSSTPYWTWVNNDGSGPYLTLSTSALAVRVPSLTTSETTFSLLNTTATTINFGGSATQINIGAGAGQVSFAGHIVLGDAKNIIPQAGTGTKIGTATTQKLGFWNATPVVQPTAVADATDAASAITQLNALLARARTIGLIAT